MAHLTLHAFVASVPEEVYKYVTAFGDSGPMSDPAFRDKHGEVLSQNGNTYTTQEEARPGEEGEVERITWRCTFEYPLRRSMVAMDSTWANREDTFRPQERGTRWTIRWDTRVGGGRGIAQYIVFCILGHRRSRRKFMEPVVGHFRSASTS